MPYETVLIPGINPGPPHWITVGLGGLWFSGKPHPSVHCQVSLVELDWFLVKAEKHRFEQFFVGFVGAQKRYFDPSIMDFPGDTVYLQLRDGYKLGGTCDLWYVSGELLREQIGIALGLTDAIQF